LSTRTTPHNQRYTQIDELWKQPRCPTTCEWIKKKYLVHTHNATLFSHKKNGIMLFSGNCMELENIMLRKAGQAQDKGSMFSFIHGS
jgi:hypothetical protein